MCYLPDRTQITCVTWITASYLKSVFYILSQAPFPFKFLFFLSVDRKRKYANDGPWLWGQAWDEKKVKTGREDQKKCDVQRRLRKKKTFILAPGKAITFRSVHCEARFLYTFPAIIHVLSPKRNACCTRKKNAWSNVALHATVFNHNACHNW